nr:translation initiation factor IF-2-like [Setaria viridis]
MALATVADTPPPLASRPRDVVSVSTCPAAPCSPAPVARPRTLMPPTAALLPPVASYEELRPYWRPSCAPLHSLGHSRWRLAVRSRPAAGGGLGRRMPHPRQLTRASPPAPPTCLPKLARPRRPPNRAGCREPRQLARAAHPPAPAARSHANSPDRASCRELRHLTHPHQPLGAVPAHPTAPAAGSRTSSPTPPTRPHQPLGAKPGRPPEAGPRRSCPPPLCLDERERRSREDRKKRKSVAYAR